MTVTTYKVEGMTCGHCVSAVRAAVGSVPGVTGVEVDLAAGTATIAGVPIDGAVAQAISDAGYDVVAAGRNTESHDTVVGTALPLVGDAGGCCCS
ncbi:probable copper ion binding protein (plasmid) [Rhodococcus jostii RHA1]|uniref:Probable copper ion binding protein n=1 Tax=Rhodococcus jostii (strain RHA1) TaxID=101510 RepID=Q0RV27_RHOJR|nr:cation transporter [Rhodococcus jostii]ABH00859.1 probable copper ion binding protein [Rhodococcus jostii RHA1]